VIQWYKDLYKKYPDLVIEACASGGARSDYAMLSQNQLVSFSDQSNYKKNLAIIVGELAAILPEQLGVWAYPKPDGDARSASFNMVNAMFCRMYLSGLLPQISVESSKLVEKGVQLYKDIFAPIISRATPFFPLGMPSMSELQQPVALGLKYKNKSYVAVWHLEGDNEVSVPLDGNKGKVKFLYPKDLGIKADNMITVLKISFPGNYMAVIFEIDTN